MVVATDCDCGPQRFAASAHRRERDVLVAELAWLYLSVLALAGLYDEGRLNVGAEAELDSSGCVAGVR